MKDSGQIWRASEPSKIFTSGKSITRYENALKLMPQATKVHTSLSRNAIPHPSEGKAVQFLQS